MSFLKFSTILTSSTQTSIMLILVTLEHAMLFSFKGSLHPNYKK